MIFSVTSLFVCYIVLSTAC